METISLAWLLPMALQASATAVAPAPAGHQAMPPTPRTDKAAEDKVRTLYQNLEHASDVQGGDGPATAETIRYTVISSDREGKSHFKEEVQPLHPILYDGKTPLNVSTPYKVDFATIVSIPPKTVYDWHPAVQRTLNVVMSGEVQIQVSDEVRRFGPGSVFIGFVPGIGHISSNPGTTVTRMLIAPIAAGVQK